MAMTKAQKEKAWAKHAHFAPDFTETTKTVTDEDMGISVEVPVERCMRCGCTRDEALKQPCAGAM